jgi:hypothetical protein
MDFIDALKWADENNVWITINKLEDNTFVVDGRCERIQTEYPFTSPEDLGTAIWAVIYALKTGTDYHGAVGY